MSQMEMAQHLLKRVPENKLRYVIAYLMGITAEVSEETDDAFCERLYQEYAADPDKGEGVSLEEMAAMCGLEIHDLSDHH